MFSVSLLLLVISVQTDGFLKNIPCHRKFKEKYPEYKNNSNVFGYNSSFINFCTTEDIPYDMIFNVYWADMTTGDVTDSVKIQFAPPKRECKYGVALLVNPSIKDERECAEYKFEKADDIKSKIHTAEKDICIFKNTNQSIFITYNDNSTVTLYKDNIWLWFKYIFRGCYALRFHIGNQKYVIREPVFLNTTYQQSEVQEPQVICKYKDVDVRHSNHEIRQEVKNFTLDAFLPGDTGDFLHVELISPRNKDLRQICIWQGEPILYTWKIRLIVGTSNNEVTDQHCSVKLEKSTMNGTYMKRVWCNFQIETQTKDHCFLYRLNDDRCQPDTIWKPEYANNKMPCLWIQRCVKTYDHWLQVTTVSKEIKSDKVLNISSYLLPIITIVLILSAVIGILCFWHYLCIRKEEVNLYINPRHDSDCPKSIDFDIIDNVSEKRIDHDNPSCDDIVLLYTNNSTSFMMLMKDFRETLAKMCSCSVHDWYNGAVWNEVARVGAVSWFIKLLNNGCRVVWIDTPFTRSVVISNPTDNESCLDKLSKYHEIHDFRDISFRVVLEVAKSKVNDVAHQYRRHFIVRFEGLESMANVNDPFLDLSPHARYYMPQHLMQLCSDL